MKEKLLDLFRQRTTREKVMLSAAGIILAFMIVYPLAVEPIQEAFARQSEQLQSLSKAYTEAPGVLERYATLQSRRNELEKFYSEINVSEDRSEEHTSELQSH